MTALLMIISLLILLFSCSDEREKVSPEKTDIQNPLVFKHNNQEFKIFTFYQDFEDFLKKAEKQPNNLEKLYQESVVEAFSLVHGYAYKNYWMFTTPSDTKALKETIDALVNKQDRVNDLIVQALKESADQLPGGDKSIYLLPAIPEFKPDLQILNYVTGEAWNKNTIIILIDPSFVEEHLQYTVAHEYHHVVAMEHSSAYTLLERSILEGKADAFAEIVYPKVHVPWSEPLTGQAKEKAWNSFTQNLNSTDMNLWEEFLNGNPSKGIEYWSNYKIGYQIMKSFLEENPEVSILEWTKLPAEDIFLKSEYTAKNN